MEQKFYTDSFEQLLRETTDDFRMYPSRKVWHSIYNDIHPSRKWPSASVLLLFIVSLLYISGYHVQKPFTKDFQAQNNDVLPGSPALPDDQFANGNANPGKLISIQPGTSGNEIDEPSNRVTASSSARNISIAAAYPQSYSTLEDGSLLFSIDPSLLTDENQGEHISPDVYNVNKSKSELEFSEITTPAKRTSLVAEKAEEKDDAYKWMQEDIFYNKKVKSGKWKNLTFQLYGTPSIGYRTLKRKDAAPAAQSFLVTNPEGPVHEYVNHDLAMNFEVGANALVKYSKNLRLKAGVQFNFTNYRIRAYELNHPGIATLTLNSVATNQPTLEPYATVLANTPGLYSTVLDNYTVQLSMPVGADYRIAGKKNIQWFAGATIQPTLVTNGNAYLLSSDMNHYINENNLIRRFNINGSLETFISYKTANGVTLNAGPQVRYQFLSTYSDQYNYDERLYNIGLKLGITTNF